MSASRAPTPPAAPSTPATTTGPATSAQVNTRWNPAPRGEHGQRCRNRGYKIASIRPGPVVGSPGGSPTATARDSPGPPGATHLEPAQPAGGGRQPRRPSGRSPAGTGRPGGRGWPGRRRVGRRSPARPRSLPHSTSSSSTARAKSPASSRSEPGQHVEGVPGAVGHEAGDRTAHGVQADRRTRAHRLLQQRRRHLDGFLERSGSTGSCRPGRRGGPRPGGGWCRRASSPSGSRFAPWCASAPGAGRRRRHRAAGPGRRWCPRVRCRPSGRPSRWSCPTWRPAPGGCGGAPTVGPPRRRGDGGPAARTDRSGPAPADRPRTRRGGRSAGGRST